MQKKISERLRDSPDLYIIRDPGDPDKLCVVEHTEGARHVVRAREFLTREEAQRWIKYRTVTKEEP